MEHASLVCVFGTPRIVVDVTELYLVTGLSKPFAWSSNCGASPKCDAAALPRTRHARRPCLGSIGFPPPSSRELRPAGRPPEIHLSRVLRDSPNRLKSRATLRQMLRLSIDRATYLSPYVVARPPDQFRAHDQRPLRKLPLLKIQRREAAPMLITTGCPELPYMFVDRGRVHEPGGNSARD
jgi:hypothetical protein